MIKFHVYDSKYFPQIQNKNFCFLPLRWGKYDLVSKIKSCDPEISDYFVIPMRIKQFFGKPVDAGELIKRAKYFENAPEKHVFFAWSDCYETIPRLSESLIFRTSCKIGSNSMPMPYYCIVKPPKKIKSIENFKYDLSFIGCIQNNPIRKKFIDFAKKTNLKCFFEDFQYWDTGLNQEQQKQAHEKFSDSINLSKFILCPRGFGLNSIRFFESLSFGRIPVLIGDDTKLPLDWLLDYSKFSIRVPESRPDLLYSSIQNFEKSHDLQVCSEMARNIWQEFFSIDSIENFLSISILNHQNRNAKVNKVTFI